MSQDTIPMEPFKAAETRLRNALNLRRNAGISVSQEFTLLERRKLSRYTLSNDIVKERIDSLLRTDPQLKVKPAVWRVEINEAPTRPGRHRYTHIKVTVRPLT